MVYRDKGDYSRAMEYMLRSQTLKEEIGDKKGLASCLNNIGLLYAEQGDQNKAVEFLNRSLKLREETNDKKGFANTLSHLTDIYVKQKNYPKALELALQDMKISTGLGFPENIAKVARQLNSIYKAKGNYQKALENYELFIAMHDSISNENTRKASVKNQLKYEYEKRSAADSVKNAEKQKVKDAQLAAQTASLKQEKFQRYSLVVGLSLVVFGLLFVINRFRITQKQKKIIEAQKIVVDEAFEKLHEKNKEVMDSIYYARRIQRALITSEKYIGRNLNRMN
jgi:tetratricopeptide (TPR) repeat protein